MTMLVSLVYQLLNVFDMLLLVYVVMSWLPMRPNQFMVVLRRIMEPVLTPIRRVMAKVLPARWMMLDFSPIVAWVLLRLIQIVLSFLLLR